MTPAVVREAWASARSQPVASLLTVLVVMGMVLTVMLTTGRTVGAEQAVLGSIDSAGTRSIVIRADAGAGVTSDVLDRAAGIRGVEWIGGFSAAVDATNAAIPDGTRVPVRYLYGDDVPQLGIPENDTDGSLAWASERALRDLGMLDGTGGLRLLSGESFGVTGPLVVPAFLAPFEPVVLLPRHESTGSEELVLLVVVASSPELVTPVSEAVLSVLAATDPSKVSVQTSETLANLRGLIEGQLGSFSRGLVMALLGLTGALVAVLLYGLVMMRRKDFGRRRALGATKSLIIALLLTQTAVLAGIGAVSGLVIAAAALLATGDPLPGAAFCLALVVLTMTTSLLAALVPAFVASRREPIRELRVP